MKIGIAIFAYNRSWHLQQVLDGLQKNEHVDTIYIFHDGLKCESHRQEWENVRKIIEGISWCDKICNFSNKNKGLAKSIIDGINFVLEKNDAIIVLEDDCVPTNNFVSFMSQCFEKYYEDKRVYSVTGYAWPINLQDDIYDIYGCGRISSWGWGTWKDRWEQYVVDDNIIKGLKKDKSKSKELATWGSDLEQTIIGNINGQTDSWAVYWALKVIEKSGICINPYKSLIHNIGMDGTGVHCGVTKRFCTEMSNSSSKEFVLPDKIKILDTTKAAFADLYGSYTSVYEKDINKENILVYGLGDFYFQNEEEINKTYNIEAFIDRKKRGWFGGKQIISSSEIINYKYRKIIIMVQNIKECISIIKNLIYLNVDVKQIILGHNLYGKYCHEISILPDGRLLLLIKNILIKVESEIEFNNSRQVLLYEKYNYYINNRKQDIVLDIGMNFGYTALYFMNKVHVKKVYGYEACEAKFRIAQDNLNLYLNNINKLEIFQYEIGEKGKKASSVFEPIIKKYPDYNIVLKMDCEGEEYGILEDLLQSGILSKITFIMLEWHYKGKDSILNCLKQAGFSWWCNDKEENMGLVYAYKGQ